MYSKIVRDRQMPVTLLMDCLLRLVSSRASVNIRVEDFMSEINAKQSQRRAGSVII
jgi:hypothetical protein